MVCKRDLKELGQFSFKRGSGDTGDSLQAQEGAAESTGEMCSACP